MGVEVKGAGEGVVIADNQNIINQVVAALKTTGGTTTA